MDPNDPDVIGTIVNMIVERLIGQIDVFLYEDTSLNLIGATYENLVPLRDSMTILRRDFAFIQSNIQAWNSDMTEMNSTKTFLEVVSAQMLAIDKDIEGNELPTVRPPNIFLSSLSYWPKSCAKY